MGQTPSLSLTGCMILLLDLDVRTVRASLKDVKQCLLDRYGIVTSLALITLFGLDTVRFVGRIENVLRASPTELKHFVDSLASLFNLIGVASAIVAQIAVVGIVNGLVHNLSWTVHASYVVSVSSAAFSVYFACMAHPALTGLDNPTAIRKWLAKPGSLGQQKSYTGLQGEQAKIHASAYAVMMILAPARLLKIAISSLVVGFGIHLGLTATKYSELGTTALVVAFLCVSIYASGIYLIPRGLKDIEMSPRSWSDDARRGRKLSQDDHNSSERFDRDGQNAFDQEGGYMMDDRTPNVGRYTSQSASEAHNFQTNDVRTNSGPQRQQSTDRHGEGSVNMTLRHLTDQQQQEDIVSILQEFASSQDRCANAIKRLIEVYQQPS